jgi:hypothetical protein
VVASVVQSASVIGTTASVTATLGSTPTVGNTLVGFLSSDTTSTVVPTAGAGASYTARLSSVTNQGFYVWTRLVASGDSATTTFTLTGAASSAIVLVEVQGTYSSIGTVATTINGAQTTRTATTVTPATTDGIVLGAAGLHGFNTVITGGTADNTFTTLLNQPNASTGSTISAMLTAYRVMSTATATGTTTFTWSGNATDTAGIQVAFTGITVAAGTRPRRIGKRR